MLRPSSLMLGIMLLAVGLLVAGPLIAGGGTTNPPGTPIDLVVLLAPFVALAAAIERFWEAVFNFYESVAIASARLVGVGARTAQWMQTEAQNAETAVEVLVTTLGSGSRGTLSTTRYQRR